MSAVCQGCGAILPPSRGGPPRKWCSERCRKASYGGICIDCGAPTDGSNGKANAPKRCGSCALAHQKVWSRERIIEAIREWAAEHGGIPPRSLDWGNWSIQRHPDFRVGVHPHAQTVNVCFGSFNAALEAAGFEPHRRRKRDRYANGFLEEVVQRIRAGESARHISRELGLNDRAVAQSLHYRGLTVTAIRRGAPT